MVVLDYIRTSYADKDGNLILGNTKVGKELAKIIIAPRAGLGLSLDDVNFEFAYNAVPPLNAKGRPKKLSKKLEKPYFERLYNKISEQKPDVILSMGNTALEALIGYTGIDKRRGIPVQKKFDGWETIVVPTYSIENTWVDANKGSLLNQDIQMTKGILKEGMNYFKKGQGDYQLITDINKVKEIFANILNHKFPIVAVDFETNSLHGEYQNVPDKNGTGETVSAKPIMISLSWKETMGVAIPLDSHANVWSMDELNYIYDLIKKMFMDDHQWKVMHNGEFDVSFLKKTIGLEYSNKVVDTLLMYYVGVNEDPHVPKGLKHLAYQYTDMGGYEDPLDEYKKDYLGKKYNDWVEDKEKKGEKHSLRDYKVPVNEVDGDKFNYDWIPLDIIYPYAAADTDVCLRIFNQLKEVIKANPKWVNLIFSFYPKLQDALTTMMANGIYLDKDYAKQLKTAYDTQLKKVRDKIEKVPEVQLIEDGRRENLAKRDQWMKMNVEDRTTASYKEFIKNYSSRKKYLELVVDAIVEEGSSNLKMAWQGDTSGANDFVSSVKQAYKKVESNRTELIKLAASKWIIKEYYKYHGVNKDGIPKVKFNPSSIKDKQYLLYNLLGYELPFDRKYLNKGALDRGVTEKTVTYTDYICDSKEAIPYLIKEYKSDIVELLMQYSMLNKALNSFIDKLPQAVDNDSLLHTNFNMASTVTSRLSSSGLVNMQQIPRRTANPNDFNYKNAIKGMFKSRFKNGVLMNIDFKTLEVFVAAFRSQDPDMEQSLIDGADFHTQTARKIFDIPEDKPVLKNVRSTAKAATFGKQCADLY